MQTNLVVQVILTIDTDNLPANFQEILQQEQAIVAEWRAQGILEHLFLRPERNGAILMFQNQSLADVELLVQQLPFYAIKKQIEYLQLIPQF